MLGFGYLGIQIDEHFEIFERGNSLILIFFEHQQIFYLFDKSVNAFVIS